MQKYTFLNTKQIFCDKFILSVDKIINIFDERVFKTAELFDFSTNGRVNGE